MLVWTKRLNHPKEQRKHPRIRASFIVTYCLRSPIPVELSTGQRNFTAVAVDIGAGGIGVVTNELMTLGEPTRLSFTLVNEQPSRDREIRRWFELRGRPLHCTLKPKAGYHVGIQFENVPTEDSQFIAEYIHAQELKKTPP